MGVRTAQYRGVQHPRQPYVVQVLAPAGYEPDVLTAADGGADVLLCCLLAGHGENHLIASNPVASNLVALSPVALNREYIGMVEGAARK